MSRKFKKDDEVIVISISDANADEKLINKCGTVRFIDETGVYPYGVRIDGVVELFKEEELSLTGDLGFDAERGFTRGNQ
jgi:hypothetical protein